MPEFNRLEILKRFVRLAETVHVFSKDGVETRSASYGRHLVVACKNLETGVMTSVKLDNTEALGTPNSLNDKLATEVYDWIDIRRKELEKIGTISKTADSIKNLGKPKVQKGITPIDHGHEDR